MFYSAIGSTRCCQILLENGADPSVRTEWNVSPAHIAAEQGCLPILKLLQHYGADLHAQDDSGDTPEQYALRYNKKSCAKYLKEKKCE